MAWFRRRKPDAARSVVALPGNTYGNAPGLDDLYGGSTAGVPVTIESALHNSAVWACQRVIVSTVGMFPVDVYRGVGPSRVEVKPPQMVRQPSLRVSQRGWVSQNIRSMLQSGNMYGRVVANDSIGRPTQLETVSPSQVEWQVDQGEQVPYIAGVRQHVWPLGDFWHVPASQFLVAGSRVAMSPTTAASTSVGTGIAAEQFGAKFFEEGAHPTLIAKAKTELTRDQAVAIKQAVVAAMSGSRAPAVIGADIDLQPWQVNPHDSQFIDLLRFEVEQACRFWGVPPSMVYSAISGQSVTYANVSQADLQFLKYSIQSWIIDLEDAWSELIAMPHEVKFNVDAILRMDAPARADLAKVRLEAKTTTINEVRALEDQPPFLDPIYDHPGIPGGAQPIAQMVREITPGVGVVMTSDEAREVLNTNGAELPVPGPPELGPLAKVIPTGGANATQ